MEVFICYNLTSNVSLSKSYSHLSFHFVPKILFFFSLIFFQLKKKYSYLMNYSLSQKNIKFNSPFCNEYFIQFSYPYVFLFEKYKIIKGKNKQTKILNFFRRVHFYPDACMRVKMILITLVYIAFDCIQIWCACRPQSYILFTFSWVQQL